MSNSEKTNQRNGAIGRNIHMVFEHFEDLQSAFQGGSALGRLLLNGQDYQAHADLIRSIRDFVEMNPLGQIISDIYSVHFEVLLRVLEIYGNAESQLQIDFETLIEDVKKFNLKIAAYNKNHQFDKRIYFTGPGSFIIFLTNSDPKLKPDYYEIKKMGENIIDYHDNILLYYVKVEYLLKELFKSAQENHTKTRENVGSLSATLARICKNSNLSSMIGEGPGAKFSSNISKVIKNRNDWAGWLDKPIVAKKYYHDRMI